MPSKKVAPALPDTLPNLGTERNFVTRTAKVEKPTKLTNDDPPNDDPLHSLKTILSIIEDCNSMRMLPDSNSEHPFLPATDVASFVQHALDQDEESKAKRKEGDAVRFPDTGTKEETSDLICSVEGVLDEFKRQQITTVNQIGQLSVGDFTGMQMSVGIARELVMFQDAPKSYNDHSTVRIPIRHTFMLKQIVEGDDHNLSLVGTFIQNQFGSDKGFDFRINDHSASDGMIVERRATHFKNIGSRRTYNIRLPMQRQQLFADFPYQVYAFSTLIELSTRTETSANGNECEVRPDLWLDTDDERSLVTIRDPAAFCDFETYSLFNPAPQVEVRYDVAKNYSPKYKITFFVEENQQQKLFALLGPLILVAVLTTLNVINSPPALDNSISLALTVVFLLPEIESEKSQAEASQPFWKQTDELFILFVFLGLILASIIGPDGFDEDGPSDTYESHYRIVNYVGVGFTWAAILLLPINMMMRGKYKHATDNTGKVPDYTITEKDSKPTVLALPSKPDYNGAPKYKELRDKASTTAVFSDTGDLSIGKVREVAEAITKTAQADFPGSVVEGTLRPAFLPSEGAPKMQVNAKIKKDAQIHAMEVLGTQYKDAFPKQCKTGAHHYLDEKNNLPYMDFMNQQVKVGLKVEEEDEKGQPIMVKDKKTDKDTPKSVVKMNPRLNKLWRVTNDSKVGKQIHICCGPQWPTDKPDPNKTKHLTTSATREKAKPRKFSFTSSHRDSRK